MAQKYIGHVSSGKLVAACLNSPSSTTVSGDVLAIEELERMLQGDGVFAGRLKVDAAWHSHHVQAIVKPYYALLCKHRKSEDDEEFAEVVYLSPTTGTRMASIRDIRDPQHWVDSLTSPVRFVESFRNMCFAGDAEVSDVDIVVEIGPHGALSGPIHEIKTTLPEFQGADISYLTCLVRQNNAVSTMQTLAGKLVRKGYPVHMEAINFPLGRNKSDVRVLHELPHYPWYHVTRFRSESRFNSGSDPRHHTIRRTRIRL